MVIDLFIVCNKVALLVENPVLLFFVDFRLQLKANLHDTTFFAHSSMAKFET